MIALDVPLKDSELHRLCNLITYVNWLEHFAATKTFYRRFFRMGKESREMQSVKDDEELRQKLLDIIEQRSREAIKLDQDLLDEHA